MPYDKRADNSTVLPAPVALTPSSSFDGNDGKWSTFLINVGDDGSGKSGQDFRVLISTSSPLTLLPMQASWCTSPDPNQCAANRGIQKYQAKQNLGYSTESSKAWKLFGTLNIPLPFNIDWSPDKSPNGSYGTDNVGLGASSPSSLILEEQVVAETNTQDFFLGSFGLAANPVDLGGGPRAPFLTNLQDQKVIPSVSYGFTAGASYRNKGGVQGNAVFGGYDNARLAYNLGTSISMPSANNQSLVVGVQSIERRPDPNVDANVQSLMANTQGFLAQIDSTIPYLYLPDKVCDNFQDKFQLQYDDKNNLYTVNDTAHDYNIKQNASLSFKIGNTASTSNKFASITLPYAAFDLQLDFPLSNGTKYFPIKKSPTGQFVLGRTFLQEAYIIVDYGRNNFTVAPATFSDPMPEPKLLPVFPKGYVPPSATPTPGKKGLAPGAVAGIAVGVVLAFLLSLLGAFLIWRHKRKEKQKQDTKQSFPGHLDLDTTEAGSEVKYHRASELDSNATDSVRGSVQGYYADRDKAGPGFPPISETPQEMESPPPVTELESPPLSASQLSQAASSSEYFGLKRRDATRESSERGTPLTPGQVHELPGDDGQFQFQGQHFEPVASPVSSLGSPHQRGHSDGSVGGGIDATLAKLTAEARDTSQSPSRGSRSRSRAVPDEHRIIEEASDTDEEGFTSKSANTETGPEHPAEAFERRPSHTRGPSDITMESQTTAITDPTPEQMEAWALGQGRPENTPERPLSE